MDLCDLEAWGMLEGMYRHDWEHIAQYDHTPFIVQAPLDHFPSLQYALSFMYAALSAVFMFSSGHQ